MRAEVQGPVKGGIWATVTDSAFGAYTPCGIDSVVRLVMGISLFNLEGQTGLAPFEMVSLIIVALAWCSMLVILGIETGIYIREFRWYVQFGAAYGGCSMLNLILHRICAAYVPHHTFHSVQVLFGVFLFVYIPQLDPYPGYVPIRNDPLIDTKYEALLGGEHVCPERDASIFSRICFGWMTPLMLQGYKRPITENDVWKLDTWDETETLIKKFHICWAEESQRPKPWLLRASNNSLGGRF
ncbi:unnamed protein product [Camellia sinensis]